MLRSAGTMFSSFGAFDDDMMEEVVAAERDGKGADRRKRESKSGLFILQPFLWGVTRDPEFPKVNVPEVTVRLQKLSMNALLRII